ncbi:MAG: hypothetical protein ACFCUG_13555 [Thiotrichales bacterium]
MSQVMNAPALMSAVIDYIPTTGLGQLQASAKSSHTALYRSTTSLTCPAGGSQAWTYTQAVPGQWASGDRWDYTATNCGLTSTLRESGRVTGIVRSSSGNWDLGGAGTLGADLTFSAVSISETAIGYPYQATLDGVVAYSMVRNAELTRIEVSATGLQLAATEGGDQFRITVNGAKHSVQINVANGSYVLDNDFEMTLTSTSDPTVNGTYRVGIDPVMAGTYNTGLDLFDPPSSGRLAVVGPNGAKIVLTSTGGGWVSLAVDTNGDGVVESVEAALWDNLYKR